MLSGPKPQLSLGAAGSTSTSLRPLRLPNFTLPGASANSVSSPPRPTFSPGWKRVPRWRTMMAPAVTVCPSNTFTPRRLASLSRPLRVEPPPLVFDIGRSAPLRDAGDLDRRVVLTVAPPAALVRLVLVGEAPDLRAGCLAHDAGGHAGAGQVAGGGGDGVAVDEQDGRERELVAVRAEALDVEQLALLDPVLLPTGLDDCVHLRASGPLDNSRPSYCVFGSLRITAAPLTCRLLAGAPDAGVPA